VILKLGFNSVLASLKASTYGLGKRLFRKAMGGWKKDAPRPFARCGLVEVQFEYHEIWLNGLQTA
jgi:hypothetical protein